MQKNYEAVLSEFGREKSTVHHIYSYSLSPGKTCEYGIETHHVFIDFIIEYNISSTHDKGDIKNC